MRNVCVCCVCVWLGFECSSGKLWHDTLKCGHGVVFVSECHTGCVPLLRMAKGCLSLPLNVQALKRVLS